MFTFTGMKVDWPPYILRPTTRLAYCTGIRRSALVIMMIATISTRKSAIIKTTETMLEKLYSFRRIYRPNPTTAEGPRETMPEKRMSEMPFPIPFSSIRSPR